MAAEDWIPWDAELWEEEAYRGPFSGGYFGSAPRAWESDWIMTPNGWAKRPASPDEFEIEL